MWTGDSGYCGPSQNAKLWNRWLTRCLGSLAILAALFLTPSAMRFLDGAEQTASKAPTSAENMLDLVPGKETACFSFGVRCEDSVNKGCLKLGKETSYVATVRDTIMLYPPGKIQTRIKKSFMHFFFYALLTRLSLCGLSLKTVKIYMRLG